MSAANQRPPLAREFLRTKEARLHGPIVDQFHTWLTRREMDLAALEPDHVEAFLERPVKQVIPGSPLHYRYMVMDYLEWLHSQGHIRFHPRLCFQSAHVKAALPAPALRFLDAGRPHAYRPVVRRFHRWLERQHLDLSHLHPSLIQRFIESPRRRSLKPRTARSQRTRLLDYLDWLFEHQLLAFDPHCLRPHPKRLPPTAEAFLVSLLPTHKKGTCDGHRTALRRFYGWLGRRQLELTALGRDAITEWLVDLQRYGLHPSTRGSTMQSVRMYLRWLRDGGLVEFNPDDLIRPRDMPKLPSYLPRPLPPDADRKLQARLAASDSPYRWGLLLMRRTGLRIGELRDLEFNPLRTDPQGHTYLKVPLGKLNNERLVPLDLDTRRLVRRLRRGRRKRRWLLETPSGFHTRGVAFNRILRHACHGLDIPDPINTHRLRHTYATSLLSAGMSLVGIMQLLGHRDYRMTLRYAAITQETVRTEYDQALAQMEKRYLVEAAAQNAPFEPLAVLADLIRWTHNALAQDPGQARLLVRRLQRLRSDLGQLVRNAGR